MKCQFSKQNKLATMARKQCGDSAAWIVNMQGTRVPACTEHGAQMAVRKFSEQLPPTLLTSQEAERMLSFSQFADETKLLKKVARGKGRAYYKNNRLIEVGH